MNDKKQKDQPKYGTLEYYQIRLPELERERNWAQQSSDYYQKELAKAHELIGRIIHQLSERWDSVRLTSFFPTDNLYSKRTFGNPEGKKI